MRIEIDPDYIDNADNDLSTEQMAALWEAEYGNTRTDLLHRIISLEHQQKGGLNGIIKSAELTKENATVKTELASYTVDIIEKERERPSIAPPCTNGETATVVCNVTDEEFTIPFDQLPQLIRDTFYETVMYQWSSKYQDINYA